VCTHGQENGDEECYPSSVFYESSVRLANILSITRCSYQVGTQRTAQVETKAICLVQVLFILAKIINRA